MRRPFLIDFRDPEGNDRTWKRYAEHQLEAEVLAANALAAEFGAGDYEVTLVTPELCRRQRCHGIPQMSGRGYCARCNAEADDYERQKRRRSYAWETSQMRRDRAEYTRDTDDGREDR